MQLPRLEHERARDEIVRLGERARRGEHHEHERTHGAKLTCAILLVAGCRVDAGDVDGAFYNGDRRKVHCAINLDSDIGNIDTVEGALDRVVATGEVVELYAHRPGTTIQVAEIERVLAAAQDRGLPFVTYAELAAGTEAHPGVALSFDDTSIPQWWELRPLFRQYGARATFFISRYWAIDDDWRMKTRELADDGHDIAAHSWKHLRAPSYVEEHGLEAYLEDEALPSIEILKNDGFAITSFAYPFGARTNELDDALLEHVAIVRSVAFSLQGAFDPCPH